MGKQRDENMLNKKRQATASGKAENSNRPVVSFVLDALTSPLFYSCIFLGVLLALYIMIRCCSV